MLLWEQIYWNFWKQLWQHWGLALTAEALAKVENHPAVLKWAQTAQRWLTVYGKAPWLLPARWPILLVWETVWRSHRLLQHLQQCVPLPRDLSCASAWQPHKYWCSRQSLRFSFCLCSGWRFNWQLCDVHGVIFGAAGLWPVDAGPEPTSPLLRRRIVLPPSPARRGAWGGQALHLSLPSRKSEWMCHQPCAWCARLPCVTPFQPHPLHHPPPPP